MPARAEAKVYIVGDAKGFHTAMRRATWEAMTFKAKMRAVGGEMNKIGKRMTYGLTLPLIGGLTLGSKAALDDAKSQKVLHAQIRNVTDASDAEIASLERWIDRQARLTGVLDDQLRPAISRLIAATGDLKDSEGLLSVAQDTAAGTGKGLDNIITAMVKGVNGVTSGFSRMGIQTKDASGKALTFAQIVDSLRRKFGGLAATKATPIDKMRVAINELGESLGNVLLPFVNKAADWLNRLAVRFQALSPATQRVIVVVGLVVAILGPLLMILGQIILIAPMVGAAFTLMTGPIGVVIVAIGALIAIFIVLYARNAAFRSAVNKAWASVKAVIASAVPVMARVAGAAKASFAAVSAAVRAVLPVVRAVVSGWAAQFRLAISVVQSVVSVVQSLVSAIQRAMSAVGSLKSVAGGVGGFVRGLIPGFAAGGDFMVQRPTLIAVGESGPERVTVTPQRKSSPLSGSAPIIIHNHFEGGILGSQDELAEKMAAANVRAISKLQRRMARGA